jgi:hypothetical protein
MRICVCRGRQPNLPELEHDRLMMMMRVNQRKLSGLAGEGNKKPRLSSRTCEPLCCHLKTPLNKSIARYTKEQKLILAENIRELCSKKSELFFLVTLKSHNFQINKRSNQKIGSTFRVSH